VFDSIFYIHCLTVLALDEFKDIFTRFSPFSCYLTEYLFIDRETLANDDES
jgi:hypothetical protein